MTCIFVSEISAATSSQCRRGSSAPSDLSLTVRWRKLYSGCFAKKIGHLPAPTGPVLTGADHGAVHYNLAILQAPPVSHPELPLWQTRPVARAEASSLAAKMHSGFTDLRSACPTNLRACHSSISASEAADADLRQIEELRAAALSTFGGPLPLRHMVGGESRLRAGRGANRD